MSFATVYRVKAAQLLAKAMHERNPQSRVQFQALGEAYIKLAEQAEKNDRLDVAYEPPPPKIDGTESAA